MVIADLPFTFVELDEFRKFVHYTRGAGRSVHVPGASTIKRRVLDMAGETVDAIKQRLQVS
jgi:hypothetical protein